MIHQYKNNGYNIVLDVNSGAIHVVDEMTYDVIAKFAEYDAQNKLDEVCSEDVIASLADTYKQEDLEEVIAELQELLKKAK